MLTNINEPPFYHYKITVEIAEETTKTNIRIISLELFMMQYNESEQRENSYKIILQFGPYSFNIKILILNKQPKLIIKYKN